MTNTISAQEWLEVIKDEYLDGFVRDGGSSIKFVVPVKEALAPLIKTRLQEIGSDLDYLVVRVDSGDTRVHMPQEIFFRIAQQVDWRLLARRVVLRLSKDAGYLTDMIDPRTESPILQAIGIANSVDESLVRMELRMPLFRAVAQNSSMSRDFRMAMTHLCLAEIGGAGLSEGAELIEWLTGRNRRVSSVRRYSIYNSIVRTNARHFLESLLNWVKFVGYSGTLVLLDNSRVALRRNPRDGRLFYSRPATMDHYELMRELIDSTDRLEGVLMVVLADEGFLDLELRGKGFFIYQALYARIGDEVQDRNQANPFATLVRLADSTILE